MLFPERTLLGRAVTRELAVRSRAAPAPGRERGPAHTDRSAEREHVKRKTHPTRTVRLERAYNSCLVRATALALSVRETGN